MIGGVRGLDPQLTLCKSAVLAVFPEGEGCRRRRIFFGGGFNEVLLEFGPALGSQPGSGSVLGGIMWLNVN